MKKITLFTGGSRSGKSRHAMNAALKYHKRAFIATAPVCDEEMEQRIAAHRAERGDRFTTIEEPTDIAAAIASVPPETEVILLDCLTVWAGNLMHKHNSSEVSSLPELEALFNLLSNPPLDIILVTNGYLNVVSTWEEGHYKRTHPPVHEPYCTPETRNR